MEIITKETSLTAKEMATACFKFSNQKSNIKENSEMTKNVDLDRKLLTMKLLILEIFKMI